MRKLRSLLLPLLASALAATPAVALDDDEVRELGKKCEAARSEALAPIRARKTQACIEQQLRRLGMGNRRLGMGNLGILTMAVRVKINAYSA